ncbi:Os04g0553000 [Oryza sativa Japonica Group]|uniref:OSJNBa0010H02.13 protein n=1 Tax=Oryza sativa subsp. japonica TaxID=39947 RepID=Q7XT37_ORYSJ|nr:Os04g0553000 [Oryza sativa Japonica Group]CAE01691.2 OSJNBa0010H02.13 [Oryza sativa Japonica Group]|eukprot:NP_001053506.2 Os04g0553000 [Oryza sativa Japonica Group]
MPSAGAGAAFLLRPISATTHPLISLSCTGAGDSANHKSHLLFRLHHSCRRLPVPRLSLTPAPTGSNNSPPRLRGVPGAPAPSLLRWSPPRAIWRGLSALLLAGQVFHRVLTGRVHRRNLLAQLRRVGPGSAGVSLLTAAFVGMAFTIQFVREFTRLGLHRSVGGVLALALSRELSPVVTAVVAAGRVGSAFAAELGTMQVSEQTDTLRVLGAQPVDYLVVPRVVACVLALPVLTLMSFALGLASSAFLADSIFGVSTSIILESARRALRPWDLISSLLKSQVFGAIIAVVSCAWGVTTHGGAKGVGESTTSAVVVSLVGIFVADFALSCLFFQGAGDSLKYAMG